MVKNKVVLLPFPFDDLSTTKLRPAICITDSIGPHEHVVVSFVTSKVLEQPLPTDVIVLKAHPDFSLTGLRVSSTIQLHRLMTISAELIKRELGTISPAIHKLVVSKLHRLFCMK